MSKSLVTEGIKAQSLNEHWRWSAILNKNVNTASGSQIPHMNNLEWIPDNFLLLVISNTYSFIFACIENQPGTS